ncbi:MAG: PD-(D/E)XK nuclease family protein [Patescibacteria group bacterium]|nr:PD-(D/E)XK nuclease family protein [Patescibacteria group bacterium]
MTNQKPDKFKAVWVSHSSIADFLRCPRTYYLRNVYKDPKTNHKITVMSPPLALGQAVHEVIESLSYLPAQERMLIKLSKRFETAWQKVSGEMGGFKDKKEEIEYKNRGLVMLDRIQKNPGPILRKAVKIRADGGLPYFWLSEEENIILCGKIDWLEYLPDDSVHIIDFKTGKNDEEAESLQLPIYLLLAVNTQRRLVSKASYWYLDRDNSRIEKVLPELSLAKEQVLKVARRIKLARQMNHFKCPKEGCFACRPLEKILKGEGKKVGVSEYNQDIYVV